MLVHFPLFITTSIAICFHLGNSVYSRCRTAVVHGGIPRSRYYNVFLFIIIDLTSHKSLRLLSLNGCGYYWFFFICFALKAFYIRCVSVCLTTNYRVLSRIYRITRVRVCVSMYFCLHTIRRFRNRLSGLYSIPSNQIYCIALIRNYYIINEWKKIINSFN